ncbi:MAG TPA: hypothetical protein VK139_07015 [Microbacteriaceae bacterium]|nr:hypothetical protein [Microbacteriaceae bacterium]
MSQSPAQRPVPAYVYRRRRLAVFGALFVVLAVIVLAIARPWAGGPTPKPSGAASPLPTAGATPLSSDAPPCAREHVLVTVYTDAESYEPGVNPQLTVGVENTGPAPCTLNVGSSKQAFTIASETGVPWVSTDCQRDLSDYPLVLQPGALIKSEPVQWDRTQSNPNTCDAATREPVPAGGAVYQLTASIDGVTANQSAQFTLK